ARKIKNSELSELVNYHEYHINRLMKAHTGYSLHEYIIRYRVSAAKKLLLSGGKSIAEIAEETGFDSPAHFSSVFRERTGETPGAYKKKMLL
ncbi:MAG: helix-turn-helix transcriptional regulator, partial [Clostridia bacterium]|nr:helix-turn-helix transcriptional regulator [Clostridia bacterium]